MTKKIPRSSLPLVLVSFVSLYIAYWVFIVLVNSFASSSDFPHVLLVLMLFVFPACLSLLIALATFLYLKRDKPTGVRQILALIAAVIFSLSALHALIIAVLNLIAFFYGGVTD